MLRVVMTWLRRTAAGFMAVVGLSACDEDRCTRHSDCVPPRVCVENACWVAYCSPEDPTCPGGTICEDGYCQAADAGALPDAEDDGGDASDDG